MTGILTQQDSDSLSLVFPVDNPAEPDKFLADLTRAMANGDDDAWRNFHARYYLPLLRYASSLGTVQADASEILQHAYLRIARHIKIFPNENDFWRWLICILRCAAADYRRGKARRAILLEKFSHWQESQHIQPSDACAINSVNSLVQDALAKLPSEDARLLRQKYYEDMSVEQLAACENTTAKAMENRLSRLRQKLRDKILQIR
jgi:RNA polymerase sigma-70 factor (ECF subfamily)